MKFSTSGDLGFQSSMLPFKNFSQRSSFSPHWCPHTQPLALFAGL